MEGSAFEFESRTSCASPRADSWQVNDADRSGRVHPAFVCWVTSQRRKMKLVLFIARQRASENIPWLLTRLPHKTCPSHSTDL
jgi:hypothetical protein